MVTQPGEAQQPPDELDHGITLPVNTKIEADHNVYDLTEAQAILSKAKKIVVEDCPCRLEHHNCDSPLNVCMSIDKQAELTLKNGKNAHELTLDEALTTLRMTHEAGLVHMAYTSKGSDHPTSICSCCSCCCNTLGPLLKKGTYNLVLSSKYIAEDNAEKCTACGVCVDRCIFRTRKLVDGELVYDPSHCMGCGVCVSTCPTNTILMVLRKTSPRK